MERFIFEVLQGASVMPGAIYWVHDALNALTDDERIAFLVWEFNMHNKGV
jgi:hypothetical protein